MRLLLAAAILALIPLACGDEETGTEPVPPRTEMLVVYGHGGGIAAAPRILEVDREGHATLTATVPGPNGPRNETSEFDLTPDQLADLEDQLAAAEGEAGPTEPSGCADCFTYSIEATGIDVDLDQVSIDDVSPELQQLVTTLERLSAP
jgi:hypothetical protein